MEKDVAVAANWVAPTFHMKVDHAFDVPSIEVVVHHSLDSCSIHGLLSEITLVGNICWGTSVGLLGNICWKHIEHASGTDSDMFNKCSD